MSMEFDRRRVLAVTGLAALLPLLRGEPDVVEAWSNQLVDLIILSASASGFSGFFAYSPAPGTGNLIASLTAAAGTDPYGNAYQAGFTSYAAPSTGTFAQLGSAELALMFAGMFSPGTLRMLTAGEIVMHSGQTTAGDTAAEVLVFSKNANGGLARLVTLLTDQVQLNVSASQNIPLAAVSGFPISGSATLATVITAVNNLYTALGQAGIHL